MTPVSPVMPGSEVIEMVLGKDQPQYVPLPAVYLDTEACPMVTRWRFSDEERKAIAARSRGGAPAAHVLASLPAGQPASVCAGGDAGAAGDVMSVGKGWWNEPMCA